MRSKIELIGERFGRLLVINKSDTKIVKGGTIKMWECQCDCGKIVIVSTSNLTTGKTKSCRCLAVESLVKRVTKHRQANKTTEYKIWANMKARCYTPTVKSFKDYGAKGITVCKEWLQGFEYFFADMGKRPSKNHTLDRYPNKTGNYEPTNCRWATWEEQQGNRTNNTWVEHEDGRKMILQDWANLLNISRHNLSWHLKRRTLKETIEFYKSKGKIK